MHDIRPLEIGKPSTSAVAAHTIGQVAFGLADEPPIARFAVSSAFAPLVSLCDLDVGQLQPASAAADTEALCTVFSGAPLGDNSPLTAEYRPLLKPDAAANRRQISRLAAKPAGSTRTGGPSNMPVTFRTRIKSSGYGAAAPVMQMFSTKTNARSPGGRGGSGARKAAARPMERGVREICSTVLKEYPVSCAALDKKQRELTIHGQPIMRVAYTHDAHRVATVQPPIYLAAHLPICPSAHLLLTGMDGQAGGRMGGRLGRWGGWRDG